jgi:hypothetical protein
MTFEVEVQVLAMSTTRSVRSINRVNKGKIDVRNLSNATPYDRMKQRVWYNLKSNDRKYSGNVKIQPLG